MNRSTRLTAWTFIAVLAMLAVAVMPANVDAAPPASTEGISASMVKGTAVDQYSGDPISGADAHLYYTDTWTEHAASPKKTSTNGEFSYFLDPDNYTFVVMSDGYLDNYTYSITVSDPRWNQSQFDLGYFPLIPEPRIKGTTTDLDSGAPLGNVNVTVSDDATGTEFTLDSDNQTGEFTFNAGPASYTLTLRKEGYYDKVARVTLKKGVRLVDMGNIGLESVKGKRINIIGFVNPVGARNATEVTVYADEAHYASTHSAKGSGFYRVAFTYGHVKVVARKTGYFERSTFITVPKDKTYFYHNVTLESIGAQNHTISGQVKDPGGGNVSGARVNLYDERGNTDPTKRYKTFTVTNASGNFSFSVPASDYTLIADHEGYLNSNPVSLNVSGDVVQDITLTAMPPAADVKGTVFRYFEGVPIPMESASVTLYDTQHLKTMSTFTDTNGFYTFSAYRGSFYVVADHDQEQTDIRRVDTSTGDREVDLYLRPHVKDMHNTTLTFAGFTGNGSNLRNWSNISVFRNLSLGHDNLSLRVQIDRTYGMGPYGIDLNDWKVNDTELAQWLEFRRFRWSGENDTSDYFTVNSTKYTRTGDPTIQIKNGTGDVTQSSPILVYVSMDFNTTELKNGSYYNINENISYDSFSTNHTSMVRLPGNFERTDTNSPFELRNHTSVIIDPPNGTGRASASFKAQRSDTPEPKAKVWAWNDGEHSNELRAYAKPGTNGSVFIVANESKLVFSGEDSRDPVGGILKYSWFFNGTTVSQDENASFTSGWVVNSTSIHYYNETLANLTQTNNYTVILKVMNRGLFVNETNISVVIDFIRPEAVINVTSTKDVHVNNGTNGSSYKMVWLNESVKAEFNGSFSVDRTTPDNSSEDYNGTIKSWQWDFNDNLSKKAKDRSNISNGSVVSHAFAVNGTYNVTLNVTDVAGNWAITNITVHVNDTTKPVGLIEVWEGKKNLSSTGQLIENRSYEFRGWRSYDPNHGEIINYTWWFPDDKTKIENSTNGRSGAGIENVTHTFRKTGTFEVRLNITDGRNNSYNASMTVVVGQQPRPDLVLTNLTFSPESLEEGVSTAVTVNVSNMKKGAMKVANASDVTIRFYVDDVEVTSAKVSRTLKPGESGKVSADSYEIVELTWVPSKSGLQVVRVEADTPQKSLENGDNEGEHPSAKADSRIEEEVNVAPAAWKTPAMVGGALAAIIIGGAVYWAWSRKRGPFSDEARTLRKKRREERLLQAKKRRERGVERREGRRRPSGEKDAKKKK